MTKWSLLVIVAVAAALCASGPATAALTAYWTFDTNYDSTVNNDTMVGTPNNGVSIDPAGAKVGAAALKVDDNKTLPADYVRVTNPIATWASNPVVTMTAWYNGQDFGDGISHTDRTLWEADANFCVSAAVKNNVAMWAYAASSSPTTPSVNATFNYEKFGPGETASTPTGGGDWTEVTIANNEWHHIATVWNPLNHTVKFYHDGNLIDYRTVPAKMWYFNPGGATALNIGCYRNETTDYARNFDGYIDEVAVLDHEPSADMIGSLVDGTATPATMAADAASLRGIRVVESGAWRLNRTLLTDDPTGLVVTSNGTIHAARRNQEVATTVYDHPAGDYGDGSCTSDGGVYRLNNDGTTTKIGAGDMPTDLVADAAGNLFFSEDRSGTIRRIEAGTGTVSTWVSDLNADSTDDDAIAMTLIPTGFTGGDGSLAGKGLVLTRGADGNDKIFVWSPDAAEGEWVLHDDSYFGGSPLTDPWALAASSSKIYVADRQDNKFYEVDPTYGTLTEVTTSETIKTPVAMVVDPNTGDLIVMADGKMSATKVVRIDAVTGEVTTMVDTLLDGFEDIYDGYYTVQNPGQWKNMHNLSRLAFSADGTKLYISEQDGDAVYELSNVVNPLPGDADNDGDVDDDDAARLAANWLKSGKLWGDGDFNTDGTVDDRDAAILAAHWVRGTGGEQSVPEPSTLAALLGMAVATFVLFRRRQV